jgi:phosphatidylserine/phosphatidylglycerophosphate/cardiolipin synthase-like enzyme
VLLSVLVTACAVGGTEEAGRADGAARCGTSELGDRIHEALLASNAERSLVAPSQMLSLHSSAHPPIVDPPQIFRSLADLIAGAKRDVAFTTFLWEVDSDPSRALMEGIARLERRLRSEGPREAPVRVRLLTWAHALTAGSKVAPIVAAVQELDLDPQYVVVDVATRTSWGTGSIHQKIAIIDGELAHITSANPMAANSWTGQTPWHEIAIVLRGEAAHQLLPTFDREWADGRTWSCRWGTCFSHGNDPIARPVWPTRYEASCLPVLALTQTADGSINNDVDTAQDQGFLAAMDAAEHRIVIESPNLNDDAAKQAMKRALLRGVEVRVVLSYRFNRLTESLPLQGGHNESNVDELYEWAFEALGPTEACRRLRIRWYSRDGRTAVDGNGEGASHVKYLSIDGEVVIVGSGNMDTQTWNHSAEVNVAIDDPETTALWDAQVFDPDFAHAIPVSACR